MIQFFIKKLNIPALLFFLNVFLFPTQVCWAESFLWDLDANKTLKNDVSPDFFLTLQKISAETEYLKESVLLLDPGFSKFKGSGGSSYQQFSENKSIAAVHDLIGKGLYDEAATRLKAVNDFSGQYPYLLYLEGWIQFKKKNYLGAVKKFSLLLKAYNGYGHNIEVSLLTAVAYDRLGEFENSLRFFNRSMMGYRQELEAIRGASFAVSQMSDPALLFKTPEVAFKNDKNPDVFRRFLLNPQVVGLYQDLWLLEKIKNRLTFSRGGIISEFPYDLVILKKRILNTEKKIKNSRIPGKNLRALKEHLAFLKGLKKAVFRKKKNGKSVVASRLATLMGKISAVRVQIFYAAKNELQKKYTEAMEARDGLPAWVKFYTSRLFYREYLRTGRPERMLGPAVEAHALFIREHRDRNFELTKEVVNRLIDLRYDQSGFDEQIVSLYKILIDSRVANEEDRITARFELGTAYYINGLYRKAGEIFKDFYERHPRSRYSPAVLFLTGEIFLKKGDREGALPYFEMASSYVDTYYALPALYKMGRLNEKMGDTKKTIFFFSEVLIYAGEFRNGFINLSVPEEREAIEGMLQSITSEAVKTIADNLYENGKTDKLFRYFNEYRDVPFLPQVLVSFSKVYKQQRDYSGQIELYRRFLHDFPEKNKVSKIFRDLLHEYERDGLAKYSEQIRNLLISFYGDGKYAAIDRSMFRKLVADSYVKSAAYHHSLAKQNNDPKEYETAILLYREYIERFNDRKNIVEVNLRLARLLAETGNTAGAGVEFTKVAWEYPHRDTKKIQKRAALAAVDSLYRHIQKNREPSQKILNLFYLAADLFVSVFPDSVDSTRVLYYVGDKQFMEKDYDNAREAFSNVIEMAPDRTILLKSMQRLALAHYYTENYLEAKNHFLKLMDYILTSTLPDSTKRGDILYQVGDTFYSLNSYDRFITSLKNWREGIWVRDLKEELWREIKTNGSAEKIYSEYDKMFARLISPFREEDRKLLLYSQEMVVLSTLKLSDKYIEEKKLDDAVELLFKAAVLTKERYAGPQYLYRAANLYYQKEELKTAYSIFKFIEKSEAITKNKKYKYPVLMRLARISDKLEKQQELVTNLLKVTKMSGIDGRKRMEAVAKAGFAYQAVGNHKEALKMFERYISAASPESRRYKELCFRAGESAEKTGLIKKARSYYLKAKKVNGKVTGKESYFSAASVFKITELDFRKYQELKEGKDTRKYIALKQQEMNKLIKAYNRVIQFGVLEFTSASYFRIGSLYEDFANTFKNSPVPKGLGPAKAKQYKRLLVEKSQPIKDKAMKIFSKNLELLKGKKFNKWIEMSLVSYARLNSLFTLKSEQVVDITDLIAPLSLKTSLVSGDVVPIPSFESLSRDSVTSNAY